MGFYCLIHFYKRFPLLLEQSHDGSRQHLVLQAEEVRSRLQEVQGVQQRTRDDQEVPSEPVQTVLPRVLRRHRLQEAGLSRRPAVRWRCAVQNVLCSLTVHYCTCWNWTSSLSGGHRSSLM